MLCWSSASPVRLKVSEMYSYHSASFAQVRGPKSLSKSRNDHLTARSTGIGTAKTSGMALQPSVSRCGDTQNQTVKSFFVLLGFLARSKHLLGRDPFSRPQAALFGITSDSPSAISDWWDVAVPRCKSNRRKNLTSHSCHASAALYCVLMNDQPLLFG